MGVQFSLGAKTLSIYLCDEDKTYEISDICDLNTKNDSNIAGCQKAGKRSTLMLTLSTLFSLQRYTCVVAAIVKISPF
jgi:hypothetical protein